MNSSSRSHHTAHTWLKWLKFLQLENDELENSFRKETYSCYYAFHLFTKTYFYLMNIDLVYKAFMRNRLYGNRSCSLLDQKYEGLQFVSTF